MAERTRVVDVRSAEWKATPEAERVYIGRANPRHGLKASDWANFSRAGRDAPTRAEAVRLYGHYLQDRPELIQRTGELRGKVLGCWCAPRPCHGDILARLADYDGHLGPLCPVCLERELEVEDCWKCGGAGGDDLYELNPTEYEPGDWDVCDECGGAGVTYWCACGKEQTAAKALGVLMERSDG